MSNIPFIIIAIAVILYIIISIRRDKLSVAASFGWIIFCLLMLFFAIFPTSLDNLAFSLGISYPPTLFLTICIVVLFVSNFRDDKTIDELKKKVDDLSQEVSILKGEKNDKK